MFIRNIWYIAGWAKDIGATPVARRICNEPIVLFRTPQGQVGALIDRCCHRGVPLSLGSVVEAGIECGYHGLVMDCSGTCVHIPGQKNIPASTKVRSYPVVEKDELIWIWMGDPELADPSQILDYPVHNDYKNWPHKHGFYRIKGNYQLLVDNLMDLTHLGYVHKTTIGGDPNTHVSAHMETRETPRGVKVVRHMPDCLPPPTYRKGVPFAGHVDRWQEFEFVPPATVLQWSGAAERWKRGTHRRKPARRWLLNSRFPRRYARNRKHLPVFLVYRQRLPARRPASHRRPLQRRFNSLPRRPGHDRSPTKNAGRNRRSRPRLHHSRPWPHSDATHHRPVD